MRPGVRSRSIWLGDPLGPSRVTQSLIPARRIYRHLFTSELCQQNGRPGHTAVFMDGPQSCVYCMNSVLFCKRPVSKMTDLSSSKRYSTIFQDKYPFIDLQKNNFHSFLHFLNSLSLGPGCLPAPRAHLCEQEAALINKHILLLMMAPVSWTRKAEGEYPPPVISLSFSLSISQTLAGHQMMFFFFYVLPWDGEDFQKCIKHQAIKYRPGGGQIRCNSPGSTATMAAVTIGGHRERLTRGEKRRRWYQ